MHLKRQYLGRPAHKTGKAAMAGEVSDECTEQFPPGQWRRDVCEGDRGSADFFRDADGVLVSSVELIRFSRHLWLAFEVFEMAEKGVRCTPEFKRQMVDFGG